MIALRRCRPAGVLAAETAAVIALTGVGSRAPFALPRDGLGQWLRTAAPADVVVAGMRWVALAAAWSLLAGTALYVVASLTRLPGAMRAVRWAALPSVRRVVDAAFAVSVVAGTVLVPAATAPAATADVPPAPATSAVRSGHAGGLASLPAAAPAPTSSTLANAAGQRARRPRLSSVTTASVTTVVVASGDNLWELAAARLAVATGRRARTSTTPRWSPTGSRCATGTAPRWHRATRASSSRARR